MVMKNNVSQNPSNAGDDDNLWPDWNGFFGVGKASRGDAEEMTFEKAREGGLEFAKAEADDRKAVREGFGKPAFEYNADSYQGANREQSGL